MVYKMKGKHMEEIKYELKIGGALYYGGRKYIVMGVKQTEDCDGSEAVVLIRDADTADKIQRKNIESEMTQDKIMEMGRVILEKLSKMSRGEE